MKTQDAVEALCRSRSVAMGSTYGLCDVSASLFFVTYEGIKTVARCRVPEKYHAALHMGAASLAEMVMLERWCERRGSQEFIWIFGKGSVPDTSADRSCKAEEAGFTTAHERY